MGRCFFERVNKKAEDAQPRQSSVLDESFEAKGAKNGRYFWNSGVEELTLEQVGRLKGNRECIALNRPIFYQTTDG